MRPRGVGVRPIGIESKAERGWNEADWDRKQGREGLGVRPRGVEFVPSNPPQRTRQRRNNLFHRCLAMSLSEAVAATYLP